MRATTRALIEDVAGRYGVAPDEIVSRAKPRLLLAARMEVAKTLQARGYRGTQIAAVLQRDHTMAYFYLGNGVKKPRPKPPKPPKPAKVVKVAPVEPRGPVRYAGWDKSEVSR